MPVKYHKSIVKKALKAYKSGMRSEDIANDMEISRSTVENWVRKAGLVRGRDIPIICPHCDYKLFNSITELIRANGRPEYNKHKSHNYDPEEYQKSKSCNDLPMVKKKGKSKFGDDPKAKSSKKSKKKIKSWWSKTK